VQSFTTDFTFQLTNPTGKGDHRRHYTPPGLCDACHADEETGSLIEVENKAHTATESSVFEIALLACTAVGFKEDNYERRSM
jgi:hypothetical protein